MGERKCAWDVLWGIARDLAAGLLLHLRGQAYAARADVAARAALRTTLAGGH